MDSYFRHAFTIGSVSKTERRRQLRRARSIGKVDWQTSKQELLPNWALVNSSSGCAAKMPGCSRSSSNKDLPRRSHREKATYSWLWKKQGQGGCSPILDISCPCVLVIVRANANLTRELLPFDRQRRIFTASRERHAGDYDGLPRLLASRDDGFLDIPMDSLDKYRISIGEAIRCRKVSKQDIWHSCPEQDVRMKMKARWQATIWKVAPNLRWSRCSGRTEGARPFKTSNGTPEMADS